jgi:hypothetical protein
MLGAMRTLATPPPAVVDRRTLSPAFGSYRGSIRRSELSLLAPDRLARLVTEKRWLWGAIVKDELMIAFCVVDLGYVSNGFAYAYSPATGLVSETTLVGLPRVSRVKQSATRRLDARFRHPKLSISVRQDDHDPLVTVSVTGPGLEVHATLDTRAAPPPITAVAPVEHGIVDVTEKRVLMPVRGSALVAGKRVSLDGALGGYDLSHGLLPRHTKWNWAFLMGHDTKGTPVALNVVQGWTREHECALWSGGELHGVPEARFEYDSARPLRAWKVTTPDESVNLVLTPGALHAEKKDLGVVKSEFKQALGTWSGTLSVDGTKVEIARAIGVAEEQDVLW